MKHVLLLTMTATLVATVQTSLAQRPLEPAAEAPSVGIAPVPTRPPRRLAAPTTVPGGNFTTTLFSNSKGDSIPPVMIRFSEPDAKSVGLEEDLYVMARVISRTLERAEGDKVKYAMGVPMLLTGSGRSVRPMYIEGLGPLFMIKVSFPLLPPPKVEDKKTAKKRAADTEWDEAHNDVFPNVEAWVDEPERGSNYNEEQVELLKKELVGALKSAANIRGLNPDEFVNIAVFGYAPPVRIKAFTSPTDANLGIALPAAGVVLDKGGAANAAKGSVLTLRAKKSDIDAFASDKLDANAFKAKVTMTTYLGSGVGSSSINTWIQEKATSAR